MRAVSKIPWMALAVGSVTGCSEEKSTDSAVTAAMTATPDAWSAELARRYCENLAGCCDARPTSEQLDRCATAYKTAFSEENARRAARWDAALAGQCLTEVAAVPACATDAQLRMGSASCEQVFDLSRGTAAEGAACAEDLDCAEPQGTSVYCDSVCVHKAASPRGAAGDACGTTCESFGDGASECSGSGVAGAQCYVNDGLYCGADNRCTALAAAGATCDGGVVYCAAGNYCGPESTCTPQRAVGEACGDDGECASGVCDPDAGKCVEPGAAGAACDNTRDCATGLTCDADDATGRFVCMAGSDDNREETCRRFSVL